MEVRNNTVSRRTIKQIFEAQHRLKEKNWEYKLQVCGRNGEISATHQNVVLFRRLSWRSITRKLGTYLLWRKTSSMRYERLKSQETSV